MPRTPQGIGILLIMALYACGPPPDEEGFDPADLEAFFAQADSKSDAFARFTTLLGEIESGGERTFAHSASPRFRALDFYAAAGDTIDIWARATGDGGDPFLFLIDPAHPERRHGLVAWNNNATPNTRDAHLVRTLPEAGLYRILVRDRNVPARSARFRVTVTAVRKDGARKGKADHIDPFIGTGGDGNTTPGAVVPWGMAYPAPDTNTGPNRASGYKAGDPEIRAFSQVHMSGIGCDGDFGNIGVIPTVGAIRAGTNRNSSAYDREQAEAGYYRVRLLRHEIDAELSATTRASHLRFTFPEASSEANLLFDLGHGILPVQAASLRIVSPQEIEGFSENGGFCGGSTKRRVYFVARLSKAPRVVGTWNGETASLARAQTGPRIGAFARFDVAAGEQIEAKIGISFVSTTNARENLTVEIPEGKTFDAVRRDAYERWNAELARIAVTGGTRTERRMFYTALYHALIHPSTFSDVNGQYRGMSGSGTKTANGYVRYHVFSLWDTYRGLHPLLTLAYPERQLDMTRSLVAMAEESGWLPRWELAGDDMQGMVADPAVPVIADTYLKGVRGFDIQAAYSKMKKSATQALGNAARPALGPYITNGYIPEDQRATAWGSVASTLEYSYQDYTIARLAHALGKTVDAELFSSRALSYQNLYDSESGFLRPRNADGSFVTPFDPESGCCDQSWAGSGGRGYVEGNAWHYLFFVPHDIEGLRGWMGYETFARMLHRTFDENKYTFTNEPDMHYPYLFTYVPGAAHRAQKEIRRDLTERFGVGRDGIPGNDDAGAMSARLVFDAIGFYPVAPGSNRYRIGSPLFDEVAIELRAPFYPGGTFTVRTREGGTDAPYIQSVTLAGRSHRTAELLHDEIVKGGEMVVDMGPTPSAWGQ